MPKYKKRDPEYTAVLFNGDNIREIMEELGPEFRTNHNLDLTGATSFTLYTPPSYGFPWVQVRLNTYLVIDHQVGEAWTEQPRQFEAGYQAVKRVGRPPKEKK